MKLKIAILLLLSHGAVGFIGFAAGIYFLPILTAPPAPTQAEVMELSNQVEFKGEFRKDLADSDTLHWGEGEVTLGKKFITFMGELAPGPDYKLYLSPEFVETEAEFNRLKSSMRRVGNVDTFENFIVPVPADVNLEDYNTVIVWCESFGEFITASQYQ